jgi:hypothetical protein
MKRTFLLQHLHTLPNGEEDVKIIGVYDSRESVVAAIGRLIDQDGFKNAPSIIDPLVDDEADGFYIDEYEVNKDNWSEGFATE